MLNWLEIYIINLLDIYTHSYIYVYVGDFIYIYIYIYIYIQHNLEEAKARWVCGANMNEKEDFG
jgi:hypothetical protein